MMTCLLQCNRLLILAFSVTLSVSLIPKLKPRPECMLNDQTMVNCFSGNIHSIILRNRLGDVFMPEVGGQYQVTAIQMGATLNHCPLCHKVYIEVYTLRADGSEHLCLETHPTSSLSHNAPVYTPCLEGHPRLVYGWRIKVQGRPADLKHLYFHQLKFHYSMSYVDKSCTKSVPFPYLATKNRPCVFPFFFNGRPVHNCLLLHGHFYCGTACLAPNHPALMNSHRHRLMTECLLGEVVPAHLPPANTTALMSTRLAYTPAASAAIDRSSVSNIGSCVTTSNSESHALKGDKSDLNWILVDLNEMSVLRMVRLWRKSSMILPTSAPSQQNEEPNIDAERLWAEGIEIFVGERAPHVNRIAQEGALEIVENNDYSYCGKAVLSNEADTDQGMETITISCEKPVIGRWVIIQKRTAPLSFCESEFFINGTAHICYINGKPTTQCNWHTEPVQLKSNVDKYFLFQSFNEPYIVKSVRLQGTSNCNTTCLITLEIKGFNSVTNEEQVCNFVAIPVPQQSAFTFPVLCRQPILVNSLKVIHLTGHVNGLLLQQLEVTFLANKNATLYPTDDYKAETKLMHLMHSQEADVKAEFKRKAFVKAHIPDDLVASPTSEGNSTNHSRSPIAAGLKQNNSGIRIEFFESLILSTLFWISSLFIH